MPGPQDVEVIFAEPSQNQTAAFRRGVFHVLDETLVEPGRRLPRPSIEVLVESLVFQGSQVLFRIGENARPATA